MKTKPTKTKKITYKHRTAMLVDDNELDNFINQKIIESNYFAEKIYVNTTGASALELLKNLFVNKELVDVLMPDIIFVDINMPLMDGFQFIDQFLKLPEKIKKKSKSLFKFYSIIIL
jgi:CheY-like chemotaxis protein